MKTLARLWDRLLGFLFPKTGKAAELEGFDAARLRSLPPADSAVRNRGIYPLFDYSDDLARTLVWEIKYNGNERLADAVAELLHEELLGELSDRELFGESLPPLLVPIPSSTERRRERGFNQTEVLARKIHGKGLGDHVVYAPNALAKVRHTPPQTELGREERLRNLAGAFAVTAPLLVRDRHVILIDDVVTTGATIEEAARALREHGAKEVIAFTIAH